MLLILKKRKDGLFEPANITDQEQSVEIPVGALIKAEYKPRRNYANLQRYMVLITMLWDNLDKDAACKFGNKETFRKTLEYLAGNKRAIDVNGEMVYIIGSISYECMPSEKEFEEHFSRLIDAALLYMPNWTAEDVREKVEKIILGFD